MEVTGHNWMDKAEKSHMIIMTANGKIAVEFEALHGFGWRSMAGQSGKKQQVKRIMGFKTLGAERRFSFHMTCSNSNSSLEALWEH